MFSGYGLVVAAMLVVMVVVVAVAEVMKSNAKRSQNFVWRDYVWSGVFHM